MNAMAEAGQDCSEKRTCRTCTSAAMSSKHSIGRGCSSGGSRARGSRSCQEAATFLSWRAPGSSHIVCSRLPAGRDEAEPPEFVDIPVRHSRPWDLWALVAPGSEAKRVRN